MKAIFMTEVGGRLMEVERREIPPKLEYYRAVRTPIEVQAIIDPTTVQALVPKKEVWIAHSRPVEPNGFAVFLLDRID